MEPLYGIKSAFDRAKCQTAQDSSVCREVEASKAGLEDKSF